MNRFATVVLVHGAFHGPSCWHLLSQLLKQRGIPFVLVDRWNTNPRGNQRPAVSHDGDFCRKCVVNAVNAIENNNSIVLVGHSQGGEAITYGGSCSPKVKRLVYLAAIVPGMRETASENGEKLPAVSNPKLWNGMIDHGDGTWNFDPNIVESVFCSDCNDKTLVEKLREGLRPQQKPILPKPKTLAWKLGVPTTYIVCQYDQAINPHYQHFVADRLPGSDKIVMESGHAPFLSKPNALADILENIALAAAAKAHSPEA